MFTKRPTIAPASSPGTLNSNDKENRRAGHADIPEITGLLTPETLAALQTPLGEELLADATRYADPLLAITVLRRRYPTERVAAAVEQTDLRRRAAGKVAAADRLFYTREALEQASGTTIAAWRARRYVAFSSVADWGCGIGMDALALAAVTRVTGYDTDPLRVAIAQANAHILGRENADFRVSDYLVEPPRADAIWCDPSRRKDGRRVTNPAQYDPPLADVLEQAAGRPLGIKVSPAIDARDVPEEAEAEFISVDGQLKEAVLWFGGLKTCRRRATILPEGQTLVPSGEFVMTAPPGTALYDPDPAILRAGAVKDLGRQLGAWQIDPEIAYLASNKPVATPFAQTLSVLDVLPWNLKELKRRLRAANQRVEEVRKRASPVDADAIRKELQRTGETPVILILTRVEDKPTAILATRWTG